jgi:hypothetical protein
MEKEEILKIIDEKILVAVKQLKEEMEKKENDCHSNNLGKFSTEITSLQNFINKKSPKKTASEEMPVIAYYLGKIDKRKRTEIDEEIIKTAYSFTDRVRPKRIKQAFVDSLYFDSVTGKKGFYRLNDDGDYFVEVKLEEKKKSN